MASLQELANQKVKRWNKRRPDIRNDQQMEYEDEEEVTKRLETLGYEQLSYKKLYLYIYTKLVQDEEKFDMPTVTEIYFRLNQFDLEYETTSEKDIKDIISLWSLIDYIKDANILNRFPVKSGEILN